MEEKKLYHFGAWSAFAMALMFIVNGVTTFARPTGCSGPRASTSCWADSESCPPSGGS